MTEVAPLWCSRWTFSSSRTAATIVALGVQLARGERREHGGVVAVDGDDDRARVARCRPRSSAVRRGGVAGDRGDALRGRRAAGVGGLVDDDDLLGSTPLARSVLTAPRPLMP